MNISFKGINNIKIGKKEYSGIGFYQKNDNTLGCGKKDYTELLISAKLTDDERGNHLSDYLSRTPQMYINKNEPDRVELHIKRFDVPQENLNQSFFKLNNKDLILDNDKKLPIMTFLARFTREGRKNPELSTNQKVYLKLANDSISKESLEYIEMR